MDQGPTVFDRTAVRRHRDRAASGLSGFDFLFRETGERLADRLDDIKRTFPVALDLGCHDGTLSRQLGGRGGIETLLQCDLSPGMARHAGARGPAFAADEEVLPLATESLDLVISNLSLHWVNDLPGTLLQIRRALKPDGLFLASLLGGETLPELRRALLDAEMTEESGASPRVSPFVDVRTAGDLLARAGFALPVADTDSLNVSYPDPFALMTDLRGMGETNAVGERRKSLSRRATLMAAAKSYMELFGDSDGRIPATFQIITLTAWAPHPGQPRPLRPGSGNVPLGEALTE